MKYFETIHQRNSAKITVLIAVILLLLLFVVGTTYMDPPEEYGVAVNFGNTDYGKGTIQPLEPVKYIQNQINEIPQPAESKVIPTASTEVKENLLTADNSEEIAVKKQQEAQAIVEAKAEAERMAKHQQEQEEKKKQLDALIGGISKSDGKTIGSQGNDNQPGDKGQLNGNLYAPSYFGDQGSGSSGVGYGLNGRGKATYTTLKQDCNESGMVIVKIVVNQNGQVIEAVPGVKGTTNTSQCLLDPAKKIALSHKWPANSKAPEKQIGFVKVNFKLGQ